MLPKTIKGKIQTRALVRVMAGLLPQYHLKELDYKQLSSAQWERQFRPTDKAEVKPTKMPVVYNPDLLETMMQGLKEATLRPQEHPWKISKETQ